MRNLRTLLRRRLRSLLTGRWLPAALALLLILGAVGAAQDATSQEADPPEAGTAGTEDKGGEVAVEASGEAEDIFIDRVEVNVVNVEVYVTDKKGNRITGLTADDFELYEDRKPMPITNFFEVRGGDRIGVDGRPIERVQSLPTEVQLPGALRTEEVPDEERLHLVVYIDNFNIRPINRNRILGDVRRFLLEKLRPVDRVMVVSYDRELHLRQPFTSDLRLAARATMDMEMLTGSAVMRDSERRRALDRIEEAQSAFEAQSIARSYAQSVENDLTFTLRAMDELVGQLAGLPGRKAILYVSDGIPMVAGQDLYLAIDQKFTEESTTALRSLDFDFSRKYRSLVDTANALSVTFYTLDAQGLQVTSSVSAEERGRSVGFFADSNRQVNLQVPLRYIANETGGKAIVNTNAIFDALEQVGDDFQSFYSLGYQPAHFGDGRYYDIDVKLKESKGRVVRHREGYRDLTPERRMSDSTYAALRFGVGKNTLGVELEFEDEQRRDDGFFLVPVKVRIPLDKLTLVPRENSFEGRMRIWVGALDERGESPVQQMPVPVSIPADQIDQARQQHYIYTITLLMRGGEQRVAVGVRDDLASETAFVTGSVLLRG